MLYTVLDIAQGVRGTENLIFGMGAETDEDCEDMIKRLSGQNANLGFQTEVSHRNRIPINVVRVDLLANA